MPEGPEVRREADRIGKAIARKRLEEAWFAFPELQHHANELQGRRVDEVEARGKAMLIRFESGLNLYSHNQLYGRWYVVKRGRMPRTNRQLRVALHTQANSALLYSASEIELLADEEIAAHPYVGTLGPNVLDAATEVDDVAERIADTRFRRRSLGALLLDQRFLSGLGNYLRSEALFVARLGPDLRSGDLNETQTAELADAIVTITRRAYRLRGVTNDPDLMREAKAQGAPRREYRHWVFSRAGGPCRLCGETIERRDSAGRRLYFCPACQSC